MELLRAVRGMNDILPEEVSRWHRLEAAFRAHAELHGYAEVRTPLIEATALFEREVGATTDIVEKEMYSFTRHDDALTVRPEGTAGAARAYVEHKVHTKEPVSRWYYLGAMFRGERPAKGRYRQFWQAGCELYGDPGPLADAEMIDLVCGFLERVGIHGFRVHVNSIGAPASRDKFREAVRDYFRAHEASLSDDSRRRLETNALRVLDSKDPRDRALAAGAPRITDHLDADDAAHWHGVVKYLDALGVDYVVDPSLVRGLDYYTRTLFEVKATASDLGAQSALGGGGRYDGMVRSLGGPETPAIGFALGLERILQTMPAVDVARPPMVYLAPLAEVGAEKALLVARELRAAGVRAEIDRGGKLKAILRRADGRGARLCIILGDEVARGVASVKDLASHAQEEISLDGIASAIAERLARPPAAGPHETQAGL
jgi:histidyl-tRNA synthetase